MDKVATHEKSTTVLLPSRRPHHFRHIIQKYENIRTMEYLFFGKSRREKKFRPDWHPIFILWALTSVASNSLAAWSWAKRVNRAVRGRNGPLWYCCCCALCSSHRGPRHPRMRYDSANVGRASRKFKVCTGVRRAMWSSVCIQRGPGTPCLVRSIDGARKCFARLHCLWFCLVPAWCISKYAWNCDEECRPRILLASAALCIGYLGGRTGYNVTVGCRGATPTFAFRSWLRKLSGKILPCWCWWRQSWFGICTISNGPLYRSGSSVWIKAGRSSVADDQGRCVLALWTPLGYRFETGRRCIDQPGVFVGSRDFAGVAISVFPGTKTKICNCWSGESEESRKVYI